MEYLSRIETWIPRSVVGCSHVCSDNWEIGSIFHLVSGDLGLELVGEYPEFSLDLLSCVVDHCGYRDRVPRHDENYGFPVLRMYSSIDG
jgi:hypothetical protein